MRKILLITIILFSAIFVSAQWQQTSGPFDKRISCFTVSGTNIFVGTISGGIFLSTDNGSNWTAVNNGLTNNYVYSLEVSGTNIFAGTWGGGVYLSTDNGSNWTAVNNGLTNIDIKSIAVSGTNIFTGTGGGVFLSTDNGNSWTAVNNGLTNLVNSFAVSGTNIFAGTNGGGVFLSTNNGSNWTAVNDELASNYVKSLAIIGTDIFAGIEDYGAWKRPLSEMISKVEELKNVNDALIYPNPTQNSFVLDIEGVVFIKLYDMLGKEVLSQNTNGKTEINISHLPNGIYNVQAISNDGIIRNSKIVKQ